VAIVLCNILRYISCDHTYPATVFSDSFKRPRRWYEDNIKLSLKICRNWCIVLVWLIIRSVANCFEYGNELSVSYLSGICRIIERVFVPHDVLSWVEYAVLPVRSLSYCAVGNYADNESRSRNLVSSENFLCYLLSLQTFHICTHHLWSLKEEFENCRPRCTFVICNYEVISLYIIEPQETPSTLMQS